MTTHDRPQHLAALLAVLKTARERLVPCSSGGLLGLPRCCEPALYTLGGPTVTRCKAHARPHKRQFDLWEHPQTDLVAAIAAYDAIEAALPDLTEDETTDWRAKYEALVAQLHEKEARDAEPGDANDDLLQTLRWKLPIVIETAMFTDDRPTSDSLRLVLEDALGPNGSPEFQDVEARRSWETIADWIARKGNGMDDDAVIALRSAMLRLYTYLVIQNAAKEAR